MAGRQRRRASRRAGKRRAKGKPSGARPQRKADRANSDEAFRCLDPRLARVALDPRAGRELPPRGGRKRPARAATLRTRAADQTTPLGPATRKSWQTQTALVAVSSSIAGLPIARLALLAQVSEVSAKRLQNNDRVSVLLEAEPSHVDSVDQLLQQRGLERVKNISRGVFIARVPRGQLANLAADRAVRFVEASVRLQPLCEFAHVRSDLVATNGARRVAETGKGVLVGIIDSGIDVTHRAFWFNGMPRIVHYRDQLSGNLYTQDAIKAGGGKQSPDEVGHGTHVAGIAAGNGVGTPGGKGAGVAPEADLAVVKTSLSTADIVDALEEIFNLAAERSQACVINLSLGIHFGAHDGSSLFERAIDTLCEERGRAVVVAAGNDGAARIHASTTLACGQATPVRWTADVELKPLIVESTLMGNTWIEVWTQREDDVRVVLRSPNGELFTPPHQARASEGRDKFAIEMSRQVAQYSQDHVTSFGIQTVPEAPWLGGWSILVEEDRSKGKHGVQVGAVHAWIASEGTAYFSNGFTRSHLIGMPGTAAAAITVASYSSRNEWRSRDPASPLVNLPAIKIDDISYFSSPGPTRNGQNKPDIAAPGQWVVSALSSAASTGAIPDRLRVPSAPYAAMQGTSMAAPYVTGAVALLLQRHPTLHWSEVKRRLAASTGEDRFSRACWNERWGHGKLSIERLLAVEP